MVDSELVRRCAAVGFVKRQTSTAAIERAPSQCTQLAEYGLPASLWQVITEVEVVEMARSPRLLALPDSPRTVEDRLVLSTVRDRELAVDLRTGEVVFFTPQRGFAVNADLESFIGCCVAYFEGLDGGSTDLRTDITAVDPSALSDSEGLWEDAVWWWEIHQD